MRRYQRLSKTTDTTDRLLPPPCAAILEVAQPAWLAMWAFSFGRDVAHQWEFAPTQGALQGTAGDEAYLVELNVQTLDNSAPFLHVGVEHGFERNRRAAAGGHACGNEAVADGRLGEHCVHVGVNFGDDVSGH